MRSEDIQAGYWWNAEIPKHDPRWRCPSCKEVSQVEFWEHCEPYCEDCGSHDGVRCPACGEEFGHVFGDSTIQAEQEEWRAEPRVSLVKS